MTSIAESVATIRRLSVSDPTVGCTEDEVAAFEKRRGITLPGAYREYLLAVGRQPGAFLSGSDLTFEELDRVRNAAMSLLEDDGRPPLAKDWFPFVSHQGYQFLAFRLDQGDDPPVSHYLQRGELRRVSPSFSQWLADAVRDEFPGGISR